MSEDTHRDLSTGRPASIGVLEVVAVPASGCWTVRITVAHADGPVAGWTPSLFDTPDEAESWLAERAAHQVRPAVRRCADGVGGLAYAVLLDEEGSELLVSAPVRRIKAAGVAALLAAELRARTRP
jgi:hypothetical protein